jgi:hypothetical protein
MSDALVWWTKTVAIPVAMDEARTIRLTSLVISIVDRPRVAIVRVSAWAMIVVPFWSGGEVDGGLL